MITPKRASELLNEALGPFTMPLVKEPGSPYEGWVVLRCEEMNVGCFVYEGREGMPPYLSFDRLNDDCSSDRWEISRRYLSALQEEDFTEEALLHQIMLMRIEKAT